MPTSLMELQSTSFKTSRHGDDLNTKLMPKLGSKARYEPARLAIARSLALPDAPAPLAEGDEEESGKVIKGEHLFGMGADLATWISLIVEHAALPEASKRDVQDLVWRHWHRGIQILWKEWADSKDDFDRFVLGLAERGGIRGHEKADVPAA